MRHILLSLKSTATRWVSRQHPIARFALYGAAMFTLGATTGLMTRPDPEEIAAAEHIHGHEPETYGYHDELPETLLEPPEEQDFAELDTLEPAATPEIDPNQPLTLTVARGDNFVTLLQRSGISAGQALKVSRALKGTYDTRKLHIGQELFLTFQQNPDNTVEKRALKQLIIDRPERQVLVEVADNGTISASDTAKTLERRLILAGGRITSNLALLGKQQDIPNDVLHTAISTYDDEINFKRDLRPGDEFRVVYEAFYNGEGERIRTGDMLHATLTLSDTDRPIYRFTTRDGSTQYFDSNGRSLTRTLLREPVKNARISSRYGKRYHPVLKRKMPHRGLDFAAPTGTKVYSAGDGVVDKIGRWGAYGRYLRIKHNGTYSTAYAHLHKYARGLKKGSRVKQGQVIAYVGSTGRSTGPHLHYEVIKNGKRVNPEKLNLPRGIELKKAELERFREEVQKMDLEVAQLQQGNTLAAAENTSQNTQ